MLNLNYNIIGSIGPIVDRQGAIYSIRLDPFSSSLILALPGNLFKDGDYTNQFGMTNAWDDISAYVKAGPNNPPIGTNKSIIYTSSLNANSHSIDFAIGNSKFLENKYDGSVYMSGINSLVVNDSFPSRQGVNLSFSSSFVIEGWFYYIDSASATTSSFTPNRDIASKYIPIITSASQYIFGPFGGDIDAGAGVNLISGSVSFVYDYFNAPQSNFLEERVTTTSSLQFTPNQWIHYAVSYTSGSYELGQPNNSIKLYYNGNKVYEESAIAQLNDDNGRRLQLMGVVDSFYAQGGVSSSAAYFQDFRFYNGTDKNYTGSIIPLPQSMVTWGGN